MASMSIKNKCELQCFSLKCFATGLVTLLLLIHSFRGWDVSYMFLLSMSVHARTNLEEPSSKNVFLLFRKTEHINQAVITLHWIPS